MEDISIHALLAESDKLAHRWAAWYCLFLSTLSLRRATTRTTEHHGTNTDFYPRSPCGERRQAGSAGRLRSSISIHALLAESDTPITFRHCTTYLFLSTLSLRRATRNTEAVSKYMIFLSTLSLRRATNASYGALDGASISIHALLAESDRPAFFDTAQHIYFYPRSPCGERPIHREQRTEFYAFLSTLSLRRATPRGGFCYLDNIISIHALLAESDNLRVVDGSKSSIISIHALLAESDVSFA